MWGDLGYYNDRRMPQALGMQVRMLMLRKNCPARVPVVLPLENTGPFLKGTAGVLGRPPFALLTDKLGGNLLSDICLLGCIVLAT